MNVAHDTRKVKRRYKKDQHRRSVETLGLSGHGDISILPKKGNKVKKGSSSR